MTRGEKRLSFIKVYNLYIYTDYIGDKIKIVLYMCIISKYSGDKEERL